MRSPLKDPHDFKSAPVINRILPNQCEIKSYAFFSGQMEFSLFSKNRNFVFLTNKIGIYDFWKHVFDNPYVVAKHADAMHKQTTSSVVETYRQDLFTYREPHMRAAIFYLLNRYSDSGMISHGNFNLSNYNFLTTHHLSNLNDSEYDFELKYYPDELSEDGIDYSDPEDVILLPIGKYKPGLLISGVGNAFDEYSFNHDRLFNALKEKENRFVICYKADRRLVDICRDYNIVYVNKYGIATSNILQASEFVITNMDVPSDI